MITIKIVKNSDRCHVSVDGVPAATFLFSNYPTPDDLDEGFYAIHEAKAHCFNVLADFNERKRSAKIDTKIITK